MRASTAVATLAVLLVLALVLAVPSCGGNGEKALLRSYESAVERLMEDEATVGSRLAELQKDLDAGNLESADLVPYAREVALPFYRRFREGVVAVPQPAEKLRGIHDTLVSYTDHRIAFLEALDALEQATTGGPVRELSARLVAKQEATEEMLRATGGDIQDSALITAKGTEQVFLQQSFEPFRRGQVRAEDLVAKVRNDVIPPYARIAESTAADRAKEGREGAVARWAKAELEYFQALAEAAPAMARAFGAGLRSREEWEMSVELRADYLETLKAYRESLR